MSQKWFPQECKAVRKLPVYWADDQIDLTLFSASKIPVNLNRSLFH